MIAFVILPIIVGLFFYICHCKFLLKIALILEALLVSLSIYFMKVMLAQGTPLMMQLSAIPLPYGMSLRIDFLAATMLLLNSILFGTMILFNLHKSYMNKLFIFLFLSLQGLINGIFLSTDFFNIYILIEVATVVVSILIMYKQDSQSMYDGMIYLMVNMIAMTFFLLGVGYLYKFSGALDFFSIREFVTTHQNIKSLILPFALLLTGVSLKAALMPLFSWLPKAHGTASAPSIVSGVLSGIFVKTGVYLFIRLLWIFGDVFPIAPLFVWMGVITAIAGFIFAFAQSDIKLILAYHTISQIGLIMIGLSSPVSKGVSGGIYHIFAHGIFKTLLFLIAGVLIEVYKTRKISEMHGLFRRSKFLSLVLLFAILSITGAPLFSGGYSKYYISGSFSGSLMEVIFIVINMGTMMSFIKFLKILLPEKNAREERHFYVAIPEYEADVVKKTIPANTIIALLILALMSLALGLFGDYFFSLFTEDTGKYGILYQLSKLPKYIITYAFSFVAYAFMVRRQSLLKFFKGLELSFNEITLAILTFFVATTVYLNIII